MNRAFKGIWIPKSIWLSRELTIQEKVFIVEIDSLENNGKGGCYAGNKYFAEFFGISESRVSNVIKCLVDKGMITRKVIKTQTGSIRYIKVSQYLKTAIAHCQNSTSSTSHNHNSQNANDDNRLIDNSNTSINRASKKNKNVNPRKK
ncbi:helix-turn-helix domain-containing protein [Zobellia laminariae]|uniref:helix-turn-helix domain-containing protein n=1 Tax=Zobellia laminariae TaxID=248906 RepID=UPI003EFA13D3